MLALLVVGVAAEARHDVVLSRYAHGLDEHSDSIGCASVGPPSPLDHLLGGLVLPDLLICTHLAPGVDCTDRTARTHYRLLSIACAQSGCEASFDCTHISERFWVSVIIAVVSIAVLVVGVRAAVWHASGGPAHAKRI